MAPSVIASTDSPAPSPSPSPHPLHDTTYTIFRLSPLHVGIKSLSNDTLTSHASILRDQLVGNVLRGVRVGLVNNDEGVSRAGSLLSVTWTRMIAATDLFANEVEQEDLNEGIQGLQLRIRYERATYIALFLASNHNRIQEENWETFPLLLVRMPVHVLRVTRNFLHTTFDCLSSPTKLTTLFLSSSLEDYIAALRSHSPPSEVNFQNSIKDVLLTLSFDLPSKGSSLRAVDLTISRVDVSQFCKAGQGPGSEGSFMVAIKQHIRSHLALDMDQDVVQISKVACGGFVLGEGKIKIFKHDKSITHEEWHDLRRQATKQLVASLIDAVKLSREATNLGGDASPEL